MHRYRNIKLVKETKSKTPVSPTLALVGEETLLGRELKEVLEAVNRFVIEEYAASGDGNFSEREGETVYLRPLDAASIRQARAVLLAGSEEGARKAYAAALENGGAPTLIDCTGFLVAEPEARLLAPLLDEPKRQDGWLLVIAHPAACIVALVLRRLARYRTIRQAVVNIFEPASERGKRGLTELHQQTTALLNFKSLDKEVFDSQLAFAVLPAYGEDAPESLMQIEERIEREVTALLGHRANGVAPPKPFLRLLQAPVFHGYSLSFWVEFDSGVQRPELEEALASAQIEVRRAGEEPPSNAAVAGQSGLIAGDIRIDKNNTSAAWVWIVADNLRLVADSAADILRNLEAESEA